MQNKPQVEKKPLSLKLVKVDLEKKIAPRMQKNT
jgi:hypothetical protein